MRHEERERAAEELDRLRDEFAERERTTVKLAVLWRPGARVTTNPERAPENEESATGYRTRQAAIDATPEYVERVMGRCGVYRADGREPRAVLVAIFPPALLGDVLLPPGFDESERASGLAQMIQLGEMFRVSSATVWTGARRSCTRRSSTRLRKGPGALRRKNR